MPAGARHPSRLPRHSNIKHLCSPRDAIATVWQAGAIHPQVIVDQLDGHAFELEAENDALYDDKTQLEVGSLTLEEQIRQLEAEAEAKDRELAAERYRSDALRTKANTLEAEVVDMRRERQEEASGAELPPEQQAAVTAALQGVFDSAAEPPAAEPAAVTPAADDPEQLELVKAGRMAALKAAEGGGSPQEVADAVADAQHEMDRAQTIAREVRRHEVEDGEPEEVVIAVEKAVRRALAAGASGDAVTAAYESAKAAVHAGARPIEAQLAADIASDLCDDLGVGRAKVGARAALAAVQDLACGVEVAQTVAESVGRTLDEDAAENDVTLYAEYAAQQAIEEKEWHVIVDDLNAGAAVALPASKPLARSPTTEQLLASSKASSRAGTEARNRIGTVEAVSAAEKAAEDVIATGGTLGEAAIAARSAAYAVSIGLGEAAAAVGANSAVITYSEMMDLDTSTSTTAPDAASIHKPKLLQQRTGIKTMLQAGNIKHDIDRFEEASCVSGEAAARVYARGSLKFEAYRAGAAAAAWHFKHPEDGEEANEAVSRSAERAAHRYYRLGATTAAATAAGEAFHAGHSAIVVDAAADAAMKAAMANEDDESIANATGAAVERAEMILQAAKRAAKASGKTPGDAILAAQAALEIGGDALAATAFTIGETLEESTAALMACRGANVDIDDIDDHLDLLVAAAMVASDQTSAGATAQMATRAGASAAASVASGASLEEVQAAARQSIPEIPGWTLESWLASLEFDKLVSEAILKRVRDAVPEGHNIRAYEQAFVAKLGEHGSVDTIMAMLKETPVLRMIAEAICAQAQSLVAELNEARLDKERAEEQAAVLEARAAAVRASEEQTARRKWTRVNLHRSKLSGLEKKMSLTSVTKEAKKSAEEINAEAVKKGAFTLSYSTDASLYWSGLTRLTGAPGSQMEKPIMQWMEEEHCTVIDSDDTFEVGNYGTHTTSRAEWFFVVRPDDGLEVLGLDEWPGAEEARNRQDLPRQAYPLEYFRGEWDAVDRRLQAAGEQPLSIPEFVALRLYTGPLFRKYNAVMRASSGVRFLENVFQDVCMGNRYATTIHVLTAAIVKLGKIVPADLVYRAPGGALPNSFWHKQPEGCQGGLELAFMSTTTRKKEAMAYARRAPGMILFEIQQGFVARGASISWLSQYPNEEEILFPPLTALEVCGTKVEGAVLIVQLRPSMKAPDTLKTGAKDIEEMERFRDDAAREIAEAKDLADQEKKRGAASMAVKQRQMHWQQSLMDCRLAASRRQAATVASKLAHEKKLSLSNAFHSTVDKDAKTKLAEKLAHAENEVTKAVAAAEAAQSKANSAAEGEQRALKAKTVAEHKLGVTNWQLSAQYGQAQFLKGLLRAKKAAALHSSMEAQGDVQPVVEAAPVEEVRIPIDHGPLGDIGPAEVVGRLKDVVGEPDSWPVRGVQPEDVEFLHNCCDKIITLASGRGKKSRKQLAEAGVFEHISMAMKRYESENMLQLKCLEVMAVCAKKAETDKIQDESAKCIAPLIETMDGLLIYAYDLLENITRNHRENTVKLVRLGGRVDWLAMDSNVVPPDQGPIAPRKRLDGGTSSPSRRN